jgi:acetolactate synthase-1/2/3 large subunit
MRLKSKQIKYSDQLAIWLKDLGYTHCFYVGGGNIMHLIESFSNHLTCRPVINEVAAGIAAEYFNETSEGFKALALVTAGPGLTNIVTAMAGAYLESRELLVIGGQVKTADLSRGLLRQRGIQEIDGVSIARPITVASKLMDRIFSSNEFYEIVSKSFTGRKGPVFIEIPLDIQAKFVPEVGINQCKKFSDLTIDPDVLDQVVGLFNNAKRPVILLGGGVSRLAIRNGLHEQIKKINCPIMTTWNGMDRLDSNQHNYLGRPNTWGQRSSNVILQQADFLLAVGTRLGLQQTGFNWQKFLTLGKVIQVDIDHSELEKGHPNIHLGICSDANFFLSNFLRSDLSNHNEWLEYAKSIRIGLPLIESTNQTRDDYVSPFQFAKTISDIAKADDIVIPCSSGGAFTTMMQVFSQKYGQKIVTNKGLASMGYGLSGAIGASFANPNSRTILIEGDGGFAQNMQEIGTAAINKLNLKIFIFDDSGYASIRMTQKNYFQGRYLGCDVETGLGLPNWEKLFPVWNIPVMKLAKDFMSNPIFLDSMQSKGVHGYIVPIDPEQTYFPKITSKLLQSGVMESNPIHIMSPEMTDQEVRNYLRYLT